MLSMVVRDLAHWVYLEVFDLPNFGGGVLHVSLMGKKEKRCIYLEAPFGWSSRYEFICGRGERERDNLPSAMILSRISPHLRGIFLGSLLCEQRQAPTILHCDGRISKRGKIRGWWILWWRWNRVWIEHEYLASASSFPRRWLGSGFNSELCLGLFNSNGPYFIDLMRQRNVCSTDGNDWACQRKNYNCHSTEFSISATGFFSYHLAPIYATKNLNFWSVDYSKLSHIIWLAYFYVVDKLSGHGQIHTSTLVSEALIIVNWIK